VAKDFSTPSIEHDPVLFGAAATAGVVAVEFLAPDRVQVYRREGADTTVEEERHRPFAWASEPVPGDVQELAGGQTGSGRPNGVGHGLLHFFQENGGELAAD